MSESLPRGQRYGSDLAIAVLLIAGVLIIEHGRRAWVLYAVLGGAAALTAAAQALALYTLSEPADH